MFIYLIQSMLKTLFKHFNTILNDYNISNIKKNHRYCSRMCHGCKWQVGKIGYIEDFNLYLYTTTQRQTMANKIRFWG